MQKIQPSSTFTLNPSTCGRRLTSHAWTASSILVAGMIYGTPLAQAQALLRTHDAFEVGAAPEWFAGMGDVNGDGIDDYAVSGRGLHPLGGSSGVAVFDGPSGAPVWFTPHRFRHDSIYAFAALGDIDGDSVRDIAVTAANVYFGPTIGAGDVCTLLSGATGAFLGEIVGSDTVFPQSDFKQVHGLDDVNGDGVSDILLQWDLYEFRVYSGAPGHGLIYVVPGSVGVATDSTVLDDLDGDGVGDFGVAYASQAMTHRTYFHSGATGQIFYVLHGNIYLTGMGDVNGDGIGDWASAFSTQLIGGEYYAAVSIRSGVTGAILSTTISGFALSVGGQLGLYPRSGGDVDGDGFDDVTSVDNGPTPLRARVVSGRTGEFLIDIGLEDVRSPAGCDPGGFRITGILGDLDGDGYAEFAAAAPGYNECQTLGPAEIGRVYIFRGGPVGATANQCDAHAPHSLGTTARLRATGAPEAGSQYLTWQLDSAPPQMFSQLAYGLALASGEVPAAIGSGLLCFSSQGAQRIGTPVQIGANGVASYSVDWQHPTVAMDWLPGTSWVIQAIFRDHLDPARANTSNAIRMRFY